MHQTKVLYRLLSRVSIRWNKPSFGNILMLRNGDRCLDVFYSYVRFLYQIRSSALGADVRLHKKKGKHKICCRILTRVKSQKHFYCKINALSLHC